MKINKEADDQAMYNLSSRWSGQWKMVFLLLYAVLFVAVCVYFITSNEKSLFSKIYNLSIFTYVFYLLIRMTYLLKRVYFDATHLYVSEKNQEVIIPLENIASIEINSLGGVYKVNMLYEEKWGKAFYFKTSLIYPLNFKKKDAMVDLLRKRIQQAKVQHFSIQQTDTLPSSTFIQ